MRVVHVHRIAGIGGSERHLLTLLPALRAHGVEPAFVGLDTGGKEAERFYAALEAAGVPATRVPATRDLDPTLPMRLTRALRAHRPDVVHTHLVHADVYGALAAARLRLPLFSTKHNDDRFRTGPFRHVERLLARRATRILAITEALRRFCVERVGLPAGKIEVVHYGLDEPPPAWGPNPDLQLPEDARLVVAVARLVEQKGLDVAVRALQAIRAEHPQAVLVVAGEGPERARLEALAGELGVRDALVLPGRAGDVAALLRRADVFVHPTRWEGFGLVLLEAMLASLPVVATRVSSVPEIVVDGETGVLIDPERPDLLADAVNSLLRDGERRRTLGAAGHERARREFSVERMAARTAALYGV